MTRTQRRPRSFRKLIVSPIQEFISDSRAVGITLLCCTLISLLISNSPSGDAYVHFWHTELQMPLPSLHLPHSPGHIINDLLMAVFFLMAGMEIKRELLKGELAGIRKAMLPVSGALGGMAAPALLYALWCGATPFSHGWGIPMATDIAFSLGILSLLGKSVPLSWRIFITALAIIDDLGGILVIAIFYAGDLQWMYLLYALIVMAVLVTLNLLKAQRMYLYIIPGILLWYFMFNSGVHSTIAGVLLALTIPLKRIDKQIHALHDPVSFIILPLFALSNTAIILPGDMNPVLTHPVFYGIISGLVIGKPLGIALFSYAAVKLKLASLPDGMSWKEMTGLGLIAGIGFTISIFMATLAFTEDELQTVAKVAIIVASLLAGVFGFVMLKRVGKKLKDLPATMAEPQ